MNYTAHVTAYKAAEAAKLRKEVGAARHDQIKAKQLQATQGLQDTLTASNRVKLTMRDLLAFGPVPEWLLVLADSADDGQVEQETIEIVGDDTGSDLVSGRIYNVRHEKAHRKVVKSESQTCTEYSQSGEPLGYTPLAQDAGYQRKIKAAKYRGIEDIVLTSKGTLRVGQGKGKRMTPRERNKMIRLQREAALAKRNAK